MSFLTVFIPSLVLTSIIGAFLPLAWRAARAPRAQKTYWGFALVVHLAWVAIPQLGPLAPAARWLAIMWLGSMLAALMLLIPFALLTALANRNRLKAVSAVSVRRTHLDFSPVGSPPSGRLWGWNSPRSKCRSISESWHSGHCI
jgi:hypothetical protein